MIFTTQSNAHQCFIAFQVIQGRLLLFLILLLSGSLQAQTNWTGSTDTDWFNTANWSAGTPDAADDVTIPGGTPNQPSIGAAGALAKSVAVQTSATLTVASAGVLTINDWADKALSNLGTVTNNGTIVVGPTVSTANFGIYNEGTFNNNLTGQLTLDRGFVTNLRNLSGTFNNAGTITIGSIVGARFGIWNSATFNNLASGQIYIDRVTSFGGPQGLYNNGTFDNAGSLTIGGNGGGGETGLQNFSVFNNLTGGQIKVDRTSTAAVGQYGGTFTNASSIIIGANAGVGTFGIWVQTGTFNNNAGGQIQIDRAGNSAINNENGFNNSAEIVIGAISNSGSGLSNTGNFTNSTCAALLRITSNSLIYLNAGSIANAGLIVENASGNSAISTNTGIVQNLNGGTFTVGSGNPPITSSTPLVNACCTPPTAAIAITENNVTFNQFTGRAYYNVSYTDGILCTGPAVPNPSTSATLTASGGTYLWSTNATTAAITTSTAGTYTVTVTTIPGCTSTATRTISVNSAPNPGTISATPQISSQGSLGVCWGSTIQLSSTVSGGVWSTQNKNPQIVSISSGGIVTPLFTSNEPDTNSVYYKVTSLGCVNYSQRTVVVIDPRNPGTISGNTNLCPGNTSQLTSNGQSGGIWASSNTNVATVSSTGLVTPVNNVNNGTTTISYTLYGFSTNPSTACPYSATALVTVAPCCAGPAALCKPANAVLVGNSATILPASVDNGSTAACGLQSITVSPNTFNCSHVGTPQTVTLTVTDVNNASNACTATVTVIDNTPPSITCPPNATVNANASCQGTVGAYSAATLADNCNSLPAVTQSPASSTILTGHNTAQTVTLTANDGNGNTATCALVVTLKDITPPTITCPANAAVQASPNCTATLASYTAAATANDNCTANPSKTQSPLSGTIITGSQIVTLTATDGANNSATCTFTVTVADQTAPSITCPANATVPAGANCTATLSSYTAAATVNDNCTANPSKAQSPVSGTTITGSQVVTLTATDGANNSAACTFTVTVVDATAPTVICKNFTTNLNAAGSASITTSNVFQSGSDNCSTVNQVGVTPNTFTCANLGANTVVLTVNDGNSNSATCSATVTIVDAITPTVICKNFTTNLNAAGAASITTANVFQSGSDNCGTVNQVSVTPNTFTCANLGVNTVVLTVNDGNNNTATCSATVTIVDGITPTVICKNFTTNLNAAGAASITTGNVFQSGSDNCGTVNQVGVTPNAFTCANLGANTVVLTVNDGNSNTATCSATVTIVDAIAPTVICKNFTTNLNAAGAASITTGNVFQSGSDNCGTVNQVGVTPNAFTCANLGANTVVLTVNDGNSNTATCSATVTIVDAIAPTVICKNFTTNLNAAGAASITTGNVFQSGSDNCGTVNQVGVTPNAFTCANLGANTVVLTVNDGNSNTATCSATVTIVDAIAPTVICKNFTTNLNAAGAASITTGNVFQSGSDNCGTVNQVSVLPNTFTCANKGTNTVVLTVSDRASNSSTCSAIVTIVDATAPTIICPANIVRANDLNQCTALVVYTIPIASDNCAGAVASHFSGGVSGAVFQKGTTIVIWRATDGVGLTGSCSFSITINDTQKPNITCPVNQTRSTDLGQCSAVVTYPTPTGIDNCGLPSGQPVWISGGTNAAGSTATFQKGATNVIWQATDAAGNIQTCSFRVTVNDTEAPTMTCPAAMSLSTATNTCSAVATYTNPSFTDNCTPTTGTSIRISGLVSGSNFPLGNSNIVFQATDAAGNTRRCTMVVTVTDNQPPVVTCPPSIIVTGSGTPCMSTVFFANATASDNCAGTLAPFLLTGLASGSVFPAGVTTNTFRVVTPNGQSANCSFTVTVNCGSGMGNEGLEDRDKDWEALQTMTYKTSLGLTIAPNPAIYSVTMSMEGVDASGGTLLVFDQIGRLVQQQVIASDQRTTTLQVAEFAPGLYRIMLKTGDGTVTRTLVVVKE